MNTLTTVLNGYISNIEYNLSQHRPGAYWPWPDSEDFARGRLEAYKEIRRYLP
jgi:hypothetical protein